MNSFFRLCSCEFIKIMKKRSTKIMLIILFSSLFVAVGISNLAKKPDNVILKEDTNYSDMIQSEINTYKQELENGANSLDDSTKNELQANIDIYQIALDNNINIYNNSYWRADALNMEIYVHKLRTYNYKSLGDEEAQLKEQSKVDRMIELIKNDDFVGYINYNKELAKQSLDNGIINQKSYEIEIYTLNLKEKYQIGKEYNIDNIWKSNLLEEISMLKENLLTGINKQTGLSLTEKTIKDCENNIKLDEYRIEHNMAPDVDSRGADVGSIRKTYDYIATNLSVFILTVIMIIIAGTSISTEILKGTIKFWSFTPNKRWKILLSKFLVVTFILIVTTIAMSLISTLIGNIFFGSEDAHNYLYVSNGSVHTINYAFYGIIYNLTAAIEIFIFMLFALMLSTVARNSVVAVGLSIATFLGCGVVMPIINMNVKSDLLRFIPFNNLNLANRIFANNMPYSTNSVMNDIIGSVPIGFSFAALGVCSLIMIVTMFDSFRKRDII